jgi:serine/tyrosine/threonine adenylyltransferase
MRENTEAALHLPFDNSYARLPARFYARMEPTPVARPRLIKLNRRLAVVLGLDTDDLTSPEGVEALAGNRVPEGAEPLSMAYAGHQFGHFVPQLGDGRALLLGEVVDRDGIRCDIHLKGSGRTPFSRGGDGRAALGPVLREYVVSEAMAALGIPTTRALAAVATGETVLRETELPGAVLARIASSHVRVGTFQYFAARGDTDAVRILADYVLARNYPELVTSEQPYLALLEGMIARQAELVAQWLLVGFIHGVMNTDNMSVAGETIDYGPCAFMDAYDPGTVFSSIDQSGRYAFANQPTITHWNLTRLAETFLPILSDDSRKAPEAAEAALGGFAPRFAAAFHAGLRRKIGLFTEREDDVSLIGDLLDRMAQNGTDFTLTFRRLADAVGGRDEPVRSLFINPTAFDTWAGRWRERLEEEPQDADSRKSAMLAVNPAFIPRNHQVEAAIMAAVQRNDFDPFEQLLAVLGRPYEDQPAFARYADPPEPHQRVLQTFCGT